MIRTLAFALATAIAFTTPTARAETVASDQLYVIDGDTVTLGRERIRILDIDTPETRKARCPSERVAGKIATDALRRLLTGPVTIERHGRDRYGRTLAHLFAGGQNVGSALVRGGFALVYKPGPKAYAARRRHWCG